MHQSMYRCVSTEPLVPFRNLRHGHDMWHATTPEPKRINGNTQILLDQ